MGFLDIIFPKRCAGCDKFGGYLCVKCKAKQPLHWAKICPVCEHLAIGGDTHPDCRSELSLDGATFVFEYKSPISILLKQLKYKFGREILPVVAKWTIEELKKIQGLPGKAVLVPIPLHPYRHNWRGFNQTELLGYEIAKAFGWEFNKDILVRHRLTKPQTEVKKEKNRLTNVHGIFSISPSYPITKLPNNLIVFDDVWTTGATIKEAGKVLKRAGVKKVWGLAIAR